MQNSLLELLDYYPCRDALGLYSPLSSPLTGEDEGEGDKRAGRPWAIGLPFRLSSPSTGVPSPLDGEG